MSTDTTVYKYQDDCPPIPPGETILETAEYYDLTKQELADRCEMTLPQIDCIISGKTQLTVDIAVKMSGILGMGVDFLLRLEKEYSRKIGRGFSATQGAEIYAHRFCNISKALSVFVSCASSEKR